MLGVWIELCGALVSLRNLEQLLTLSLQPLTINFTSGFGLYSEKGT